MPPQVSDLLSASTVSGWDLGFAALSIVAAWIVSIFAKRGVLAVLRKMQGISEGAASITARAVRYAILLVGVGVAFAFLGASIQPLIAVALVVAAVVILALRGISANFAAGVVLQTRHPIKVGDEINVDDMTGTIKELNGRSVVLVTRDGRTVHVPNSLLLERPLVNHSELGHRRSEVQVRASVDRTRTDHVIALVQSATTSVGGVLTHEPVRVLLQSVEPNRLTLLVRFWHHPLNGPTIVSQAVRAVADALGDAEITSSVTSVIPVSPLVPPPAV